MSILRRLFRPGAEPTPEVQTPPFSAPIQPSRPFFAIGDVHGQVEHLRRALETIRDRDAEAPIVCVGDFVDRGEHSAQALDLLQRENRDGGVICLMGNHEHMMLRFLDDPEEHGERWLRYGGLQTLASYQVGRAADLAATRDALAEAMGADLIGWLRDLPSFWLTGNVAVTHAGADPSQPVGRQSRRNLLWGHRDFGRVPRSDGIWVVHGHTIVDLPMAGRGRIAIDTGAYATGKLTVAAITRGDVSFFQV